MCACDVFILGWLLLCRHVFTYALACLSASMHGTVVLAWKAVELSGNERKVM